MDAHILFNFKNTLRIQELGFRMIKHPYTHPDRRLDWDVFLYIADGQMQVWEEDREYVVKKGQFLFLKSGLHHWGEPKTPGGTAWYWIHFFSDTDTDICQEFNTYLNSYQSISREEYNKFIKLPKQGTISHPQRLEKSLDQMIELFKSADPFRTLTLSWQAAALFVDIFSDSMNIHPLTKSERTVQRIIEYLERKESYSLNSKDVEACLNMNYSYLCEVFKAKTGSTIHMHNSKIFINKSIDRMRNTNLNISEISESLGFNNPFYFSRVFRIIGCSPSEYMVGIYRNDI